jgi:hypothetical protein
MDDIVLTRTLLGQGFDDRDLVRMRRDGSLLPVRRGAYVRERAAERSREREHRELIFATNPLLHDGAVVSHASAAVLHGLPTWPKAIDRVHVTRNRNSGGNRRSIVHVHTAPLPDDQVMTIDGVPVTSLVRTVWICVALCPSNRRWPPATGRWLMDWYAKSWRISLPG